jgi:hypothetical protein
MGEGRVCSMWLGGGNVGEIIDGLLPFFNFAFHKLDPVLLGTEWGSKITTTTV